MPCPALRGGRCEDLWEVVDGGGRRIETPGQIHPGLSRRLVDLRIQSVVNQLLVADIPTATLCYNISLLDIAGMLSTVVYDAQQYLGCKLEENTRKATLVGTQIEGEVQAQTQQ